MFFFLSKTIGKLFLPGSLIAVFLLWGLFVKNPGLKRKLLITSVALFFFFTNEFLAIEAARIWETPLVPMNSIDRTYSTGILLTGVTQSHAPLKDRIYVTSSPDRVNHTVMLFKKGIIKNILISGGSGELLDGTYSEAVELRKLFLSMGVPDSVIRTEGNSRNTFENAVESVKLLKDTDPNDCLLITSAFHMPRASACFKKAGFDCPVFPTDTQLEERQFTPDQIIIPSTKALKIWERIFKETLGLISYTAAGYI
ncbi:MAG: YdcF family protein [Bacteroidetes bacterium]|nr:YdcF family protein [Bacteroidota bacterium]